MTTKSTPTAAEWKTKIDSVMTGWEMRYRRIEQSVKCNDCRLKAQYYWYNSGSVLCINCAAYIVKNGIPSRSAVNEPIKSFKKDNLLI